MTVGRDYLMKQPSRPSAPKVFLDTRIIPGAVNVAGSLEVALDRVARRAGVRPALLLSGGVAITALVALRLWRSRSTAPVGVAD